MIANLSITAQRQIALEKLRSEVNKKIIPVAPHDGIIWTSTVFPQLKLFPPADRHKELWQWVENIEPHVRPRPLVCIWPRGSGKSTSAELATTYLGANQKRKYVWYVSATQEMADNHVDSIAALIENQTFAKYYPKMAERKVGKFGNIRGWRRNRLRCGNGFTIDALGLDVGARGRKVEDQRPDLIILDDIDELYESASATDKKIQTIISNILPAGSKDVAILCIQNLIKPNGFFGKMLNGKADYLRDRILRYPSPAVINLQVDENYKIISGTPTWVGQDLATCQHQIDTWGYTAFLHESQHEVKDTDSLFDNITFNRVESKDLPKLLKTIVVVDPAVTAKDNSDSHGISVAALGEDDKIYCLYSHEEVLTPYVALKLAVEKAIQYGSNVVYIETNQGGELWSTLFYQVVRELKVRHIGFEEIRATAADGGKVERASSLLAGYETKKVAHVIGTHDVLEAALKRFPASKPYDLVDATVHAYNKLANQIWYLA